MVAGRDPILQPVAIADLLRTPIIVGMREVSG
jgi:hypothetical protein